MSLTGFLSYSRVNWQQSPSKSTPWNATNLNIMDAGIKNNNDMISNLRNEVTQLNSNIDVKNSFCKNIASINGTLEGYGYNYCYYNKSTKTGILYFASKIETPDSSQNNFTGYYDVKTNTIQSFGDEPPRAPEIIDLSNVRSNEQMKSGHDYLEQTQSEKVIFKDSRDIERYRIFERW